MSLTGRLVDKLTFAFENTKSVNFPQNNVRFVVQVMVHFCVGSLVLD